MFVRLSSIIIIAVTIALYRYLTKDGAIYSRRSAKIIYAVIAIVGSLTWIIGAIAGTGRPSWLPRNLIYVLIVPAICFLFTQLVVITGIALTKVGAFFVRAVDQVKPQTPDVVEPKPEIDTKRRVFLRRAASIAPLIPMTAGTAGVLRSVMRPVIEHVNVKIPNLPIAFNGFTIVQISDLHVGPYITYEDVRHAVHVANSFNPDLVALTGDLVNHSPTPYPQTAKILSQIKAKHGAYAVLGNHEYFLGVDAAIHSLPKAGIPLLRDEHRIIKHRGERMLLSGLDYSFRFSFRDRKRSTPKEHVAKALSGVTGDFGFKLGLTHHPHDFDQLRAVGTDLTLAGHTHGGQIALGQLTAANLVFEYTRGLYQKQGKQLYVNSGTGHWLPMRIGCPTEITVIHLSPS